MWRSDHLPAIRGIRLGLLGINRTLRHEALDVLYYITTIQLTSSEIMEMMVKDNSIVDKFRNIIVSERYEGINLARLSCGHSFYSGKNILQIMIGRRLQTLSIDVDLLLTHNRPFGICDAIHVASAMGLSVQDLRCIGIGCYAFMCPGELSKLQLYHGVVATAWEHATTLSYLQLRRMHQTYHKDSFRCRSRNIWRQQGYQFPPLCQRVYLAFLFWLSDLRFAILLAKQEGGNHEILWKEWLGLDGLSETDLMPGGDACLHRVWTSRLAHGLDNVRRWLLNDE